MGVSKVPRFITEIEEPVDSTDKILDQHPHYDRVVNYQVQLNLSSDVSTVKINRQALGIYRTIIVSYDESYILNSTVYEVQSPDGQVKQYAANITSDNIMSQVDKQEFRKMIMDSILDHMKYEALDIPKYECYIVTTRG